MNRLLLLIFCLSAAACTHSRQAECPFTGVPDYAPSAGCLSVIHGRVLVVDSRKGGLTPPGGKTLQGESAQCAAHRETLEETGLDLMPGQLLDVFDTGFHLYYCEIHVGSGLIDPPGAVSEVRRGFWLPMEEFDDVHWLYPGQGERLRNLIAPSDPHPAGD